MLQPSRVRRGRKEVEQKHLRIDFCSETSATVQVESSLKAAIHSEVQLPLTVRRAQRVLMSRLLFLISCETSHVTLNAFHAEIVIHVVIWKSVVILFQRIKRIFGRPFGKRRKVLQPVRKRADHCIRPIR